MGFASGHMGENTTIGVVATDVRLDKGGCKRLAMSAHDGLALAIRPAHTPYDGDTLFSLSTGERQCEPAILHMAVVEAVARATANAALAIKEMGL
jgi:L-aminopeptidase/D-esterase-like protein